MNFNDIMVVITGVLCFLVGVLLVPMMGSFFYSSSGFNLPVAVTGVIDFLLIVGIVWTHTKIVLYNQKRKIRAGTDIITAALGKSPEPEKEELP
jgi:hypothetical protein